MGFSECAEWRRECGTLRYQRQPDPLSTGARKRLYEIEERGLLAGLLVDQLRERGVHVPMPGKGLTPPVVVCRFPPTVAVRAPIPRSMLAIPQRDITFRLN